MLGYEKSNHIKTIPFYLPGFEIESVENEDGVWHLYGRSTARSARCPCCEQASESRHNWHQRHPQELPCIGQGVRLHLQVNRFRCSNLACPRKTFVEQFPDWLPAYARRTTQLTDCYTFRRSRFPSRRKSSRAYGSEQPKSLA
ncbi:MAG: transposase family protein [Anaerolineae bacterium]|nr:transposase family protein [Anaerolineae bacterium]